MKITTGWHKSSGSYKSSFGYPPGWLPSFFLHFSPSLLFFILFLDHPFSSSFTPSFPFSHFSNRFSNRFVHRFKRNFIAASRFDEVKIGYRYFETSSRNRGKWLKVKYRWLDEKGKKETAFDFVRDLIIYVVTLQTIKLWSLCWLDPDVDHDPFASSPRVTNWPLLTVPPLPPILIADLPTIIYRKDVSRTYAVGSNMIFRLSVSGKMKSTGPIDPSNSSENWNFPLKREIRGREGRIFIYSSLDRSISTFCRCSKKGKKSPNSYGERRRRKSLSQV